MIVNDFSDIPFEDSTYRTRWHAKAPANEWNLNVVRDGNFQVLARPAESWSGLDQQVEIRSVFEWRCSEGFGRSSKLFKDPTKLMLNGVLTEQKHTALSDPFFAGHKYPTRWRMYARWTEIDLEIGLILEQAHGSIRPVHFSVYILKGKERRSKCLERRVSDDIFFKDRMCPVLHAYDIRDFQEPMCIRCVMSIPEMNITNYCVTDDILSLGADMLWLLDSGKDSDCVIALNNARTIHIHKNIVSVRSSVLERAFEYEDTYFARVDHQIMYEVLSYVYSGKLNYPCPHILTKMKKVAGLCGMGRLWRAIEDYLGSVTPENPKRCDVCDPEGILIHREFATEQKPQESQARKDFINDIFSHMNWDLTKFPLESFLREDVLTID